MATEMTRATAARTAGTRRGALAARLLLLLLLGSLPLLLFTALDRRSPTGHDLYYTAELTEPLNAWRQSSSLLAGPAVVGHHFLWANDSERPALAQSVLLGVLGTFGPSITAFRLASLPFLLLLLLGSYLAAREVAGHRAALFATFVVATLPGVVAHSRTWIVFFHAMGLSALALFLALRLLRSSGRKSLPLWAAFGAVAGLRLYTHPIVLPDIAVLFVALALFHLAGARQTAGGLFGRWLPGWSLALLVALVVGGWYLGLFAPLGADPSYALGHYGSARATDAGIPAEGLASLGLEGSHAHAAGRLVTHLYGIHWMPAYTLLLLLPAIVGIPLVVSGRMARNGETVRAGRFLALVVGVQVPVAVLTVSHDNLTRDWMGLTLPLLLLVVLGLGCLRRLLGVPDRWVRVYVATVVAAGTIQVAMPLVAPLVGPDPLVARDSYRTGPWVLFSCGESRYRTDTYHLASLGRPAVTSVARTLRDRSSTSVEGELALLGLWQLTCEQDGNRHAWRWSSARDKVLEDKRWPFVFAGFRGLTTLAEPRPEQARFHVVRLVVPDDQVKPPAACAGSRCMANLEEARQLVMEHMGPGDATAELLSDDEHWFLPKTRWDLCDRAVHGRRHEVHTPSYAYLGRIILVDRGEGPVLAGEPGHLVSDRKGRRR